jgi:hypothetical protein
MADAAAAGGSRGKNISGPESKLGPTGQSSSAKLALEVDFPRSGPRRLISGRQSQYSI